jgi:hypothetical protein
MSNVVYSFTAVQRNHTISAHAFILVRRSVAGGLKSSTTCSCIWFRTLARRKTVFVMFRLVIQSEQDNFEASASDSKPHPRGLRREFLMAGIEARARVDRSAEEST